MHVTGIQCHMHAAIWMHLHAPDLAEAICILNIFGVLNGPEGKGDSVPLWLFGSHKVIRDQAYIPCLWENVGQLANSRQAHSAV